MLPLWCFAALTVSTSGAAALELDSLLPADVPGYGTAPSVSILSRVQPEYTPFDINYETISLLPSINAGGGYDSSPNGTGNGSSALNLNPSLLAEDTQLGFGAYVAGAFSEYPQANEQDTSGYTVAIGQRVLLPRETVTLAAAAVSTQETGFGFNTAAILHPIGAEVNDFRGSDKIVDGMLTLTPELSISHYTFSNDPSQDRTDYRQSVTGEFTSGGPTRLVTALRATESQHGQRLFNAYTYSAYAGIADEATGMWQLRLLAGVAARKPDFGKSLVAPVLESSLSWMPSELDSLTFDLAREIDDPDQESAEGYTLSTADVSIAHEYLRNVIITGSAKIGHAAYFNSPLVETLYNGVAQVNWHLNRALALDATYQFNSRQTNYLRAANEHILTLDVTWTP